MILTKIMPKVKCRQQEKRPVLDPVMLLCSRFCVLGFFFVWFFFFSFLFFFLALPQRFKQFMACGHVLSLGSDQVLNFP